MRKEIKSKSKRKWIVGGAMLFGGIALLTTGFATWIVGTTIRDSQQQAEVTIDTVKNVSFIMTATLEDSKIDIVEPTTTDANLPVRVENGRTTDFSIKVKINITRGSDAPTVEKVRLTLAGDTYDDGAAGNNVFRADSDFQVEEATATPTHAAGTYSYVEMNYTAENYIEISLEDSGWDANGEVYEFTHDVTLLKWGSYFGTYAPTSYYNTKLTELKTSSPEDYDEPTDQALVQYVLQAGKDLEAMEAKFTPATGKKTLIALNLQAQTIGG